MGFCIMGFRVFGERFARRFGSGLGVGGGASGVIYTLRDQFTTDRAAGSVNGTLSEPSGHVRTVTDTNNKLSITGGVASVATGGGVSSDPSLWYPSIARVAGLIVMGKTVITTNTMAFGVDTNQAGVMSFGIIPNVGNTLSIYDFASFKLVGSSIAAGTSYQMAIALRGTGCFYFIKGGTYTFWTLIWISVQSSAAVFPSFQNTAAIDVYTVDDIRIPATIYIPLPLAYDTFTRANGALGSTETTSPDAQTIAALVWAFTVGIWAVATNKAVGTPALGADVIVNGAFAADTDWTKGAGWAIGSGTANATAATSDLTAAVAPLIVGRWYQAELTISAIAAGSCGIVLGGSAFNVRTGNGTNAQTGRAGTTAFVLRGAGFTGSADNVSGKLLTTAELFASVTVSSADVLADVAVTLSFGTNGLQSGLVVNLDSASNPQNFIICYLDGRGNCVLEECVAGVYTTKITAAITYSAGAVLRVERDGTNCRVFYNNLVVGTVQTMTANTNVNHGLFSTSAINSLDGFTIWHRGQATNYYSALDAFV